MARALWKGFFLDKKILKKKTYIQEKNFIKTRSRNSVIPFSLLRPNLIVGIYTGKLYKSFKVESRGNIGYKLGEFAFTRKHGQSKKGKKKKKTK